MRTYDPEDSVSNEISRAVQSAQLIGMSLERFVEITKMCWIEELQDEIKRIDSLGSLA